MLGVCTCVSDDRAGIKMSDATQHDAHTSARKAGAMKLICLSREIGQLEPTSWDEVEVVQCLRRRLVDSLW